MSGSEQLEELVDRLQLDQRSRWLGGQRVAAEWYLDRHPALRSSGDALISLVYGEYCLRDDLAEAPEAQEYLDRFPKIAPELTRLFDVDRELSSCGFLGVTGPSFPRRLNWPGKNKPLVLIDDRPDAAFPPASAAGFGSLRLGYIFYSLAADCEPDESRCSGVDAYQPLSILGSGSTGVVYLAKRRGSGDTVAVKFITLGPYETGELATLLATLRAVAALAHPGLVGVYEASVWNGLPYLVEEYVEGQSLATRLSEGPLTASQAARLVSSLAQALAALHQAGLVHGNLKPTNVLLGEDGRGRICDAGIAAHLPKAAHFGCLLSEPPPAITVAAQMRQLVRAVRRPADTALVRHDAGYLVGHPCYLAPEQLSGKAADLGPAADIYALGAVWYCSLAGRPPIHAGRWQATLDLVRRQPITPPGAGGTAATPAMDELLLRCLNRDPGLRPTAADLVKQTDQ